MSYSKCRSRESYPKLQLAYPREDDYTAIIPMGDDKAYKLHVGLQRNLTVQPPLIPIFFPRSTYYFGSFVTSLALQELQQDKLIHSHSVRRPEFSKSALLLRPVLRAIKSSTAAVLHFNGRMDGPTQRYHWVIGKLPTLFRDRMSNL